MRALHVAAAKGHSAVVEALLQAGAQHTLAQDCTTPLNQAIAFGKTKVIKVLLHYGALTENKVKKRLERVVGMSAKQIYKELRDGVQLKLGQVTPLPPGINKIIAYYVHSLE